MKDMPNILVQTYAHIYSEHKQQQARHKNKFRSKHFLFIKTG